MILVIDAGNSNIVFALMEGEEVIHTWRSKTHARVTEETLARGFEAAQASPEALQGGILGSVVPNLTSDLARVFKDYTGQHLDIVGGEGFNAGVEIRVDVPGEVGADRILNIVAGVHYYGAPLIIIDFGTAITYDVVDREGAYIGGAIGAGVGISLKALHSETAQLPLVEFGEPPSVIAKNAFDAMQSASFFGALAAIEGMVERIEAELGTPVKTIATGGFSSHFKGKTKAIDFFRPDLTLQGLRLMFERGPNG